MSRLVCTKFSLVPIDVRIYQDSGANITTCVSPTGLLYALVSYDRWNRARQIPDRLRFLRVVCIWGE